MPTGKKTTHNPELANPVQPLKYGEIWKKFERNFMEKLQVKAVVASLLAMFPKGREKHKRS